jgi:transposase
MLAFRREAGMGTHSDDLRERVVAEVQGGSSRRSAAERFRIGVSSAIRWAKRHAETGSVSPTPRGGRSRSPLAPHTDWLLALVAAEPDLTLDEMVARVAQTHGLATTESSLRRFFKQHRISRKKDAARRRAGSPRRGRRAAGLAGRPGRA